MRIAKVISAFVGITMVVGSIGLAIAGTFMVVATDDVDGYISVGPLRARTDAAALLGDDIDIFLDESIRGGSYLGLDNIEARLTVDSRNGKELFVGVGPASEVSRYLAGSSYSVVDTFNDRLVLDDFPGTVTLSAPGDQDFWVATADEVLNWNLEQGNWSVVVMNDDGSTGIDSAVTVAGRVPFLRPIGAALLVAGIIGLVVGVTLTYFGVRGGPTAALPAQPQPQPPLQPAPVA